MIAKENQQNTRDTQSTPSSSMNIQRPTTITTSTSTVTAAYQNILRTTTSTITTTISTVAETTSIVRKIRPQAKQYTKHNNDGVDSPPPPYYSKSIKVNEDDLAGQRLDKW